MTKIYHKFKNIRISLFHTIKLFSSVKLNIFKIINTELLVLLKTFFYKILM